MGPSMSEDGPAVGFVEDTPVMVRTRVRPGKSGATGRIGMAAMSLAPPGSGGSP
jgi:hypothetical protein